jgi:hypothetical protein
VALGWEGRPSLLEILGKKRGGGFSNLRSLSAQPGSAWRDAKFGAKSKKAHQDEAVRIFPVAGSKKNSTRSHQPCSK